MSTESERRAANNDLMDPDWLPPAVAPRAIAEPPIFIEKSHYDALKKELNELEQKRFALKYEIDQRWEPALRKAREERDQFQQELMNKHEELVERVTTAKNRHEADLKDAHAREDLVEGHFRKAQNSIEQLEKQNDELRAQLATLEAKMQQMVEDATT